MLDALTTVDFKAEASRALTPGCSRLTHSKLMATSMAEEKNEGEEAQQNLWQAMLQRCSRKTSEADSHLIVLGLKNTPLHTLCYQLTSRENELLAWLPIFVMLTGTIFVQEVHTTGNKVYSNKLR